MAGISSFATVVEAPLVEDSLQSCMTRVFGAMESFAVSSENAYEQGSYIRAEEDKAQHDDRANGGALDALVKIREHYEHKRKVQRKMYYDDVEAHKLKAMEICANKIKTKTNISIDFVSSILENTNKLRDEELCPQTHDMIRGYVL
ncbi:hypothetical protein HU200_062091 [Digitaria exilis]|uniref:DUF632 domain-containing protein n=1 Tax=Digitaria exilis TaxID=1010633 RepID=A0A835DXM8_9POAL|nr:hypothetical protein HU200_062091 [Digitaria exilis]